MAAREQFSLQLKANFWSVEKKEKKKTGALTKQGLFFALRKNKTPTLIYAFYL